MGNPGADTVQQLVSGRIISPDQGLLKSQLVGRTVALEHQPTQAQQGRTVVAAVVDFPFESRSDRKRDDGGYFCEDIA